MFISRSIRVFESENHKCSFGMSIILENGLCVGHFDGFWREHESSLFHFWFFDLSLFLFLFQYFDFSKENLKKIMFFYSKSTKGDNVRVSSFSDLKNCGPILKMTRQIRLVSHKWRSTLLFSLAPSQCNHNPIVVFIRFEISNEFSIRNQIGVVLL